MTSAQARGIIVEDRIAYRAAHQAGLLGLNVEIIKTKKEINPDIYFKIFAVVLIIAAGLVLFLLWKNVSIDEKSYKRGFHEGVASTSAKIAHLQQKIMKVREGLALVINQKR